MYVALHEVTWCMVVWCTQNLHQDDSSFMWHQSCQHCKHTTSVDVKKMRDKKLVTHVESHVSTVRRTHTHIPPPPPPPSIHIDGLHALVLMYTNCPPQPPTGSPREKKIKNYNNGQPGAGASFSVNGVNEPEILLSLWTSKMIQSGQISQHARSQCQHVSPVRPLWRSCRTL